MSQDDEAVNTIKTQLDSAYGRLRDRIRAWGGLEKKVNDLQLELMQKKADLSKMNHGMLDRAERYAKTTQDWNNALQQNAKLVHENETLRQMVAKYERKITSMQQQLALAARGKTQYVLCLRQYFFFLYKKI